ncbi:MAG: nitroreductase family protein [Thermonemataceae bacterium]
MSKTTPTDYEIHDLLKKRWSPRVFSEKPVSEAELKQLLEAGRWAASSNNLQPWRIIWGRKGDGVFKRIFDCLHDFNKQWADNASVLIVGAYKTHRDDGKENFHALHDLGLFMGNLSLQATTMNIALHQMAGIDPEKTIQTFSFPEGYHVATAVAVGYYGGEVDKLPENLQKMETKEVRERKPQSEWAFNGNFGG